MLEKLLKSETWGGGHLSDLRCFSDENRFEKSVEKSVEKSAEMLVENSLRIF